MAVEAQVITDQQIIMIIISALICSFIAALGWSIRRNIAGIDSRCDEIETRHKEQVVVMRDTIKAVVNEVHLTCDSNVDTLMKTKQSVIDMRTAFNAHEIEDRNTAQRIEDELRRYSEGQEELKSLAQQLNNEYNELSKSFALLSQSMRFIADKVKNGDTN